MALLALYYIYALDASRQPSFIFHEPTSVWGQCARPSAGLHVVIICTGHVHTTVWKKKLKLSSLTLVYAFNTILALCELNWITVIFSYSFIHFFCFRQHNKYSMIQ